MSRELTAGSGVKIEQLGAFKNILSAVEYSDNPLQKTADKLLSHQRLRKNDRRNGLIRDTRQFRITDMIDKSRIDTSFDRRRQMDVTGHAYRNRYALMVDNSVNR